MGRGQGRGASSTYFVFKQSTVFRSPHSSFIRHPSRSLNYVSGCFADQPVVNTADFGHLSFVIRHSSFVIRHSSFVIRHSSFVIRHRASRSERSSLAAFCDAKWGEGRGEVLPFHTLPCNPTCGNPINHQNNHALFISKYLT